MTGQQAHSPFGEGWYASSSTTKFKFTSYERDSESGNDYAMMRTSVNRLGRFSSPDRLPGSIGNPQSLNRFTYAFNDVINLADPMGLCAPGADDCITVTADPISGGDPWFFSGGGGAGGPIHQPLLDDPPDIGHGGGQLSWNTALLGPMPQPPPPPGYEQCIMEALQEVIHAGETPGEPNSGYGTVVRGVVVRFPGAAGAPLPMINAHIADPSSLTGHPGIVVDVGGGQYSTAFGRYQILSRTAASIGMTDFSPRGQDAAAEILMQRRNMVVPAMNGDFALAMQRGGLEWASLPGSPYGQPTLTLARAQSVFQNALNTLPDCQ